MRNTNILFMLLAALFILTGCRSYKYGASNETEQTNNLTYGIVKEKIIKGETKQDEVLALFGSPNIITKNKSNNEVWSYNKMSVIQKAGQTIFFDGARASGSTSSQSFDLIITFDDNDFVIDYSVISTKF